MNHESLLAACAPLRWLKIALAGALMSCGGGGGDDGVSPPPSVVTISLDQPSVSLVGIGVSKSVQATVTGAAAVTWRSADEQVVRVNSSGTTASIVSQGPGSTSVTATAGTASATVTVNVAADLHGLSLSLTTLSLTVDDEKTATVSASPVADPGIIVSYTWTSSNAQVATVVASGSNPANATVSAVGVGSTSITLTARTQFGATRSASLLVNTALAVRAVILSEDKTDMGVGRSLILAVRVTGDPAFPKTVTWNSSNSAVLSVGFTGRVTANTPGIAKVFATSTADPAIRDSVIVQVTATPFVLADFAFIPSGTFQMGTANLAVEPLHQVTLTRPFLMQKTEVTQSQWQSVMGNNPSNFQLCGGDCPVEQISWNDVQTFISRLNDASPGITYRLPTEAEWEYAARAGSTVSLGVHIDSIAWLGSNSMGLTHSVGQKQPNAWGLYDAVGNVGEWVQDFAGPLSTQAVTDPTGPIAGERRVIRGLNYLSALDLTRAHSSRGEGTPNSTARWTGVRLARSP